MRITRLFPLLLALAGCETPGDQCAGFGHVPGTSAYAYCNQAMEHQRRAILGDYLSRGGGINIAPVPYRPMVIPTSPGGGQFVRPTTTCVPFGNTFSCTTQ